MIITELPPCELNDEHVQRWRAFQLDSGASTSAFTSGEFVQTYGRHMPNARVLVVEDAGRIIGYLALERGRFRSAKALGLGLTDMQCCLLAPDSEVTIADVLSAARIDSFRFDRMQCHSIRDQNLLFQNDLQSPFIDISVGWESWIAEKQSTSRSRFRRLRQLIRQLERDHGPIEFTLMSASHADLDTLIAWKSAQYRRTGRRDRFADERFRRVLHDLLDTQTDAFHPVLAKLCANERVVALDFGIRHLETLSGWFPAYDLDFAKYSVGNICMYKQVENGSSVGIKRIDLGVGEASYKDSFMNNSETLHSGMIARPSIGAAAQWCRYLPTEIAVNVITSSPRMRATARSALNKVGSLRQSD